MKAYVGVELYLQLFLASALERCDWSASRPGRFNPWERTPVPIDYEAG